MEEKDYKFTIKYGGNEYNIDFTKIPASAFFALSKFSDEWSKNVDSESGIKKAHLNKLDELSKNCSQALSDILNYNISLEENNLKEIYTKENIFKFFKFEELTEMLTLSIKAFTFLLKDKVNEFSS